MVGRNVAIISDIIVHHTAGPTSQTAYEIDTEHRNIGMAMIGYNFLIAHDGAINEGRPIQYVPAAAFGRNHESINVCLVGNFEHGDHGYTGPPSAAQIVALKQLSVYLHSTYPQISRTIGHRDVATLFYPGDEADYATACPGDQLYALLPDIKDFTRQNLHNKT